MNLLLTMLLFTVCGIIAVFFVTGAARRFIPVVVTAVNIVLMAIELIPPHHFQNGWLMLNSLGAVVTSITLFVGFTASIYSVGYIRSRLSEQSEGDARARQRQEQSYYTGFLLFYLSLMLSAMLANVFLTWAAIEFTALSSVLLVDWHNTRLTHEASWKYLVIMESAGLLALFGLICLVGYGHIPIQHATWSELLQSAPQLPAGVERIGFAFVLVGFGSKAGLVPFNAWLPDAHSEAPSPISAMLSAIKLNCALYGILQVQAVLRAGGQSAFANHTLLTIGFVTVGVSTLMTVYQHNFKRLFAYSSSENLGMVAIGFALGPIGVLGAYLQMVNHSLIKSMLFYHTGELQHLWKSNDMRGLSGVAQVLPRTGRSLMLGMLAIAGAPPFGLFVGEFLIVFDLLKHVSPWLAILLLLLLAILFANFLRYAISMGYGETSSRLLRHGVPIEAGSVLTPTALHLAMTLALGILLPLAFLGLHVVTIHG